jgi:hypothetical protein
MPKVDGLTHSGSLELFKLLSCPASTHNHQGRVKTKETMKQAFKTFKSKRLEMSAISP